MVIIPYYQQRGTTQPFAAKVLFISQTTDHLERFLCLPQMKVKAKEIKCCTGPFFEEIRIQPIQQKGLESDPFQTQIPT